MIEKLDKNLAGNINSFNMSQNILVAHKAIEKINELVDAVNELQEMRKSCDSQIGILAEQIAKLQHDTSEKANCQENVQADPFAEQRRWLGKLCKFWDIDNDYLYYGPLTKIHDAGPYCYECNHRICYLHCELVSEDLIYKGQ